MTRAARQRRRVDAVQADVALPWLWRPERGVTAQGIPVDDVEPLGAGGGRDGFIIRVRARGRVRGIVRQGAEAHGKDQDDQQHASERGHGVCPFGWPRLECLTRRLRLHRRFCLQRSVASRTAAASGVVAWWVGCRRSCVFGLVGRSCAWASTTRTRPVRDEDGFPLETGGNDGRGDRRPRRPHRRGYVVGVGGEEDGFR